MKTLSLVVLLMATSWASPEADAILKAPSFLAKVQLYCGFTTAGHEAFARYNALLASQPKTQQEEMQRQRNLELLEPWLVGYYQSLDTCIGSYVNGWAPFPSDDQIRAIFEPPKELPKPVQSKGPEPDHDPVIVYKVEPEFFEAARRAKWHGGTIHARIDIDEQGHVIAVRVLDAPPALNLEPNIAHALQQWRFKPAIKNGAPIARPADVAIDMRSF